MPDVLLEESNRHAAQQVHRCPRTTEFVKRPVGAHWVLRAREPLLVHAVPTVQASTERDLLAHIEEMALCTAFAVDEDKAASRNRQYIGLEAVHENLWQRDETNLAVL